jgi:hypothetical protein
MSSLLKVLGLALAWFGFALVANAQAPAPDMILAGGNIITVDARDSTAEALAIKDGRISAIGPAAQCSSRVQVTDRSASPCKPSNRGYWLREGQPRAGILLCCFVE